MLSNAVLQLQENGKLEELKDKWWKPKGGESCSEVCETYYRRRKMTLVSTQVLTSVKVYTSSIDTWHSVYTKYRQVELCI